MSPPNPFHYGTPVVGEQFVGRERELDALVSRMRDGINVVVLSPRRYGKTSLLLAAEERLAAGRPRGAVVRANVLRSRDLATLVGRLAASAYRMPGARWHRTKQAVPDFLRRLRVRPGVSFDEQAKPTFSFEAGLAAADAEEVIADLYALLAEAAGERPAVVVLDEFQAITDHGAHLPDLLKALADAHPAVSLVVAGSRRHLMERLVSSEQAPLYGMAQKLSLAPIPDDVMVPFLQDRARAGGKPMDEPTAGQIVALAGPVPNDIQHLAYEAFEVAGRRIDPPAVTDGLDQAVAHEASTFAELFASRPPGQRRVLVALAAGPGSPVFSSAFARSVGLAGSNSVKRAVDALDDNEIVVLRQGRPSVADPFLGAWLRAAAGPEPNP
ncbi:MAG: AAA family ATPase [Acidimicrobiia bacterium]